MILRFQDRVIYVDLDTIDSRIRGYDSRIKGLIGPLSYKHPDQRERNLEKITYLTHIKHILENTRKILKKDENWIDYVSSHNIQLLSNPDFEAFKSIIDKSDRVLCKVCKYYHVPAKTDEECSKLCSYVHLYCHKCHNYGHTSHTQHCRVCKTIGHDKWVHKCTKCGKNGHTYDTCQSFSMKTYNTRNYIKQR